DGLCACASAGRIPPMRRTQAARPMRKDVRQEMRDERAFILFLHVYYVFLKEHALLRCLDSIHIGRGSKSANIADDAMATKIFVRSLGSRSTAAARLQLGLLRRFSNPGRSSLKLCYA